MDIDSGSRKGERLGVYIFIDPILAARCHARVYVRLRRPTSAYMDEAGSYGAERVILRLSEVFVLVRSFL